MKQTNQLQALCAGEALIDLISDENGILTPCLGGAVYNLARTLSLQGIATGYLNPTSGDWYGSQLRAKMQTDGVVLLQAQPIQAPTSLAMVYLDEQGKAQYAFYREGIADRQTSAQRLNELSELSHASPLICTGCLALAPDDASIYLPWLATQKQLGRTIAIDVNIRAKAMKDESGYQANVLAACELADIIKGSDEDFAYLSTNAAQLQMRTKAKLILTTLGADGAQLLSRDGTQLTMPAPKGLALVDTVGAGDCFFAGFLAYWLKHPNDLQNALNHAVKTASFNCSRQGCQSPTWQEALDWKP